VYGSHYSIENAVNFLKPRAPYTFNDNYLNDKLNTLEEIKQLALKCPLEDMPLLINETIFSIHVIALWRLKIAK
jgi:hypothetical protein